MGNVLVCSSGRMPMPLMLLQELTMRIALLVAAATFSGPASIDDDDNILAISHTRKKFVSTRILPLVVRDEGETVKGVYHLMANNDAGPISMTTTRPPQFATT